MKVRKIKKMKIIIMPKSKTGKWSIGLMVSFFIFLALFFFLINLGERGGEGFFNNLNLTIPFLLAVISACLSFFLGLVSIFKNKESSVFVFLATLIGFFVFLWILSEILFPH
jgi:hypothetical protein